MPTNVNLPTLNQFSIYSDGILDATTVIQEAIDNNTFVNLPVGTYRTTSTLNLTGGLFGGSIRLTKNITGIRVYIYPYGESQSGNGAVIGDGLIWINQIPGIFKI